MSLVLKQEEMLWYQKSWEISIKFEDQNTKKISYTNHCDKEKLIPRLFINGVWCEDARCFKWETIDFFHKKLFSSFDRCHPDSLHLRYIP